MHKSSPWYAWDPASPGFILRKHDSGKRLTWEDIERVLAAYPEAIENPIIADYAEKARRGKLPKAAGRRRSGPAHLVRLFFAREMVEEKMTNWREARRRGSPDAPRRGRGEKSLFELAYEEVAREMRFAMSGPSLMNAISRMRKSHPYFFE